MSTIWPKSWPLAAIALATACVSSTTYERAAHRRLASPEIGGTPAAPASDRAPDGTLAGWLIYAADHHPLLSARVAEWRASVYAVAEARRLPEPTISYGVFARPVETRVGPQRQRIGVRQTWPWPERRRAAGDAASSRAQAAEQHLQAAISAVRWRVAEAYWQLWAMRRIRAVQVRQQALLAQIAETVRSQIAVGKASVADVAKVDLMVARRADAVATLDAHTLTAEARLRRAVGAPADTPVPPPILGGDSATAGEPALAVPDEDIATLRAAARHHPGVAQHEFLARASIDQERVENARARPDVALALDYTQIGRARVADVADSGKDAWLVGVSVTVPLWRSTYRDAGRRARAEAASHRARERLAGLRAEAELEVALTEVRDGARRAMLYRDTLIPQAEAVYEATLGTYHTGDSELADLIASRAAILELHIERIRAIAAHAIAWARVEDLVGRPVSARPADAVGAVDAVDAPEGRDV